MASEMVRLLRSFDDDVSRRRRRGWWRLAITFTVVKLLGFIAVGALAWLSLSPLARASFTPGSASWNVLPNVVQALELLQFADFAVAAGTVAPSRLGGLAAYRRALVNAVAARDSRLTQATRAFPGAHSDAVAATADGVVTIGPLAHPMRTLGLSVVVYILGALASVAVVGIGAALFIVSLHVPHSFVQPVTMANWFEWLTFPCALILLGVMGVVVALVALHYHRMERADVTASIDVDGVTFARKGARERSRLRWHDAHGFALISFADVAGRMHEVYVLSSATEDFVWTAEYVSPHAPSDLAPESASWRLSAHQLVDQVVQRSGLPLLDLSQTVAAVAATDIPASSQAASTLLARASIIARQQGDAALVRDLSQRLGRSVTPAWVLRLTRGAMLGMNRMSTVQRGETLRLARELLPYVPLPGQLGGAARARRRLISAYWWSELLLIWVVAALAFALSITWFVVAH